MKKDENISKFDSEMTERLIENFVALQKVMTNLSAKFDNLSDKISGLLEIFEISAKSMAEKDYEKDLESEYKELLEKINTLIEQNKTIARGLSLLHERKEEEEKRRILPSRRPRPRFDSYENYY